MSLNTSYRRNFLSVGYDVECNWILKDVERRIEQFNSHNVCTSIKNKTKQETSNNDFHFKRTHPIYDK